MTLVYPNVSVLVGHTITPSGVLVEVSRLNCFSVWSKECSKSYENLEKNIHVNIRNSFAVKCH